MNTTKILRGLRDIRSPGLLQAAVLMLSLLSARAVDIIGFSIASPKNSSQNYLTAGDWAGAPGVRTNNWNNILSTVDGATTANIILADGTISNSAGAVVSGLQATFHPNFGNYNRTAGGTNDGKMFADVSDIYNATGFSGYGYLDLTNIPYAKYNIYCYFRPDNGNGAGNTRGGFWLITNAPSGSVRYYIKNQSNDASNTQIPVPSNTGGNYVQSTTTGILSGGDVWANIQGGNYAVFPSLTNSATRIWFGGLGNGTGGKDDLGNYVNGGSAAVRFKVAGFQIVQVPDGSATNLYLTPTNPVLHAGNPVGSQVRLLADLDTGALAVDVTSDVATTYASDNTNIFGPGATGILRPGTNGTARLISTYKNKAITNLVTVTGPTALSISVANTNLLLGNHQGDSTKATLYATFSDATNVIVNAYNYVSFSASPSGVLTVTTNGTLTAAGLGQFSVTATYDQLSVTTNNVGVVTAYPAPGKIPGFSVNLTDQADPMLFHDLSGAPGARLAYWNNLVMTFGNVTNELDNPVDYHGAALAGTVVQVLPNNPFNQLLVATGTRTTNESLMFNTYFDQGANDGSSPQSYIVVSNVPYLSYDAYFYFYNDNSANGTNRPGQVTIDGVTQYRINSPAYPTTPDNTGAGYVQALPQPASAPTFITNIPYGNLIKFTGLTDTTLNVTWGALGQDVTADAASVTRARLAGFQLVKSFINIPVTNVYLQAPVPILLPGSPTNFTLTVLADFITGETGGNITALPGIAFNSASSGVFTVDTNGVVYPGLTPGVATLTITYQTKTLNVQVTNLAPSSVVVQASPDTVYLDGTLSAPTAQGKVIATFAGGQVDVTGFGGVTFVDQGMPAATVSGPGVITPVALGTVDLGATYLGTTYVTANAFTVASISGAAVLKHEYSFTDAPTSTTVADSIGGANGTLYPPLGTNKPITLDGAHAIFPGDGDYTTEPYISLPAKLIASRGDVTIELWCGQNQLKAWSRFLGFGNTPKGTNPHTYGGVAASSLQFIESYAGTGRPDFAAPGAGDLYLPFAFTNGAEYHVVMVYAPNAGTAAVYVNGVLATNGTPTAAQLTTSVNDTVDWLGVSLSNDDPPLAGWINNLKIYEGVLTASQVAANYAAGQGLYLPPVTVSTSPVAMTTSVSGGNLHLTWPPDHKGWTLQTNAVGLAATNAWYPYAAVDTTATTNVTIPLETQGNVFFRIKYP